MWRNFGCVVLLCIGTLLIADELDPDKRFTVIVDHVPVEADPRAITEDFEPKTLDLSTITVHISAEVSNGDVENGIDEMGSAHFVDGQAVIEGELSAPILVSILIKSGEDTLLSTRTRIAPREVISVAILDHQDAYTRDQLALVGSSTQVIDSKKKFTILGNFTSVDMDLTFTTARVTRRGVYELGNRDYGTVLLSNGCFLIEGEVAEPTVVMVNLDTGSARFSGWTYAVVEPGAVIRIAPERVWSDQLFSAAGIGKHAELVESWLRSEEYRTTFDLYAPHVAKDEPWFVRNDKQIPLSDKLWKIRQDAIDSIAQSSEDPINRLLALEMSAFLLSAADALPVYDKVISMLEGDDTDLVARRVLPARENLVERLQIAANRHSLVPGKKAPDFILPDLSGDEISLADVVSENELVLIDFWASWCAPCIAEFPDLKQLYSEFSQHGLEIVSISIDSSVDDWEEAATQQKLPWISVADIGGFKQDTPKAYGVHFVPKKYLLDQNGLIIKVDLSIDQLRKLLEARYASTSPDTS